MYPDCTPLCLFNSVSITLSQPIDWYHPRRHCPLLKYSTSRWVSLMWKISQYFPPARNLKVNVALTAQATFMSIKFRRCRRMGLNLSLWLPAGLEQEFFLSLSLSHTFSLSLILRSAQCLLKSCNVFAFLACRERDKVLRTWWRLNEDSSLSLRPKQCLSAGKQLSRVALA